MAHSNFAFLDEMVREIGREKAAAAKSAKPLSEAGGYEGASAHPSADVDDHTIVAREGFRSAENAADVKSNRESPTVDATAAASADASAGTPAQDKRQLNIGTNQSSTGQDPGVEDDFKGDKDDPGTTSVMKADDGDKYAAYRATPLRKLAAMTIAAGNALLADVANGPAKRAAAPPVVRGSAGTTQPVRQPAATATAGLSVKAAEARAFVEDTIKEAAITADLTLQYLADCEKAAADGGDGAAGEDHAMPPDMGGAPPPDMGGGGPPPGMGGGPPGMGGGGPPGMGGAPPPGLDGAIAGQPGMDQGQASPEEALHQMAAALMEMGIDPQQLADIARTMGGAPPGDGGGAPPPGGGPPPPGDGGGPPPDAKMAYAQRLFKVAGAVEAHRRSGRFAFDAPASPKAAALRGRMREYVAEALRHAG